MMNIHVRIFIMNDYEQVNYQIEKNNIYDVLIIKLEYCEQCEQYEWFIKY